MFRLTNLHFFLVAHCLIFSHNQPFRLWGGCTGGGEGGCTCILCIPPGYAPGSGFRRNHSASSTMHTYTPIVNLSCIVPDPDPSPLVKGADPDSSFIYDSFCFVIFFVGVLKVNDENSRIRIHKSEA